VMRGVTSVIYSVTRWVFVGLRNTKVIFDTQNDNSIQKINSFFLLKMK
jgi:hypothetical protein